MASLKKFLALTGRERTMLLKAFFMLPLSYWALRLLGFYRFQSLLIRLAALLQTKPFGSMNCDHDEAHAAARMVDIAARRSISHARCLQKSLVLWWLLRRRGTMCEVWFGVRKDESGLEAHAWVEWNGVVLNDRCDVYERFAAFRSSLSSVGMQLRHV
jgi:hypothetical protein